MIIIIVTIITNIIIIIIINIVVVVVVVIIIGNVSPRGERGRYTATLAAIKSTTAPGDNLTL